MFLISKYRAPLMGLSILWILFFHSGITFPATWFFSPFELLKKMGYAGVEIFFLLSGVGLAFSLEKGEPILVFYKKRALKVVPLFLMASVLMYILEFHTTPFHLLSFLNKVIGLDVFLGGAESFFWFIPVILSFYIIAPFLYKLLQKRNSSIAVLMWLIYLLLLLVVITVQHQALIWYTRLPVFVIGLYVGLLIYNHEDNKYLENFWLNFTLVILCSLAIVSVFHFTSDSFRWRTGLWWFPTVILAYPVTRSLTSLLHWSKTYAPYVITFFSFFGLYTLELYITHTFVYKLPNVFSFHSCSLNINRMPEYVIYILISLLISMFLKKQMSRFL